MPQQRPTFNDLSRMQGQPVYGSDGEKIGDVDVIYYDDVSGEPEWIAVGPGMMGSMFGKGRRLIPLQSATLSQDSVHVPYSKDRVKDSPDIDSDEISVETERELYQYYGIDRTGAPSETRPPTDRPLPSQTTQRPYEPFTPDPPPDDTLREPTTGEPPSRGTEREPIVGGPPGGDVGREPMVTEPPAGARPEERRVRLRKWVETDPATGTETEVVERERVKDRADDEDRGDQRRTA